MTTFAVPAVEPAPGGPPATMRDRVPGQALIEQVLLRQGAGRPLSRLERVVGRDPLDPEARPWYTGALGERQVAARLATLPDGWTVLHSLPVGRSGADVDHLVVGPAGVFTINTKHHVDASVWVAGRTVLVAGQRQPYAARSEAEARRVDRMVAEVVPEAPAVRPLVVLVGAKRLTVKAGPVAVTVLKADALRRWLVAQPARLSPAQVQRLVDRFADPCCWQPAVEAGPELLLAFRRVTREVRRAARTRLAWAGGLVALTAGGTAAMLAAGVTAALAIR